MLDSKFVRYKKGKGGDTNSDKCGWEVEGEDGWKGSCWLSKIEVIDDFCLRVFGGSLREKTRVSRIVSMRWRNGHHKSFKR